MENGIVKQQSLGELQQLSSVLCKASLLPAALRGKEADVLMTIMAGGELGLAPMQSIRLIHIIEGKPAMSADLIAGLCLSKPDRCEYVTCLESTSQRATYEAKRVGSPKPVTMSFSMDQARAAGLVGKQNWARYPDAMLRARALSAICRAVFPDLVGGLYDPDELSAEPVREVREVRQAPNVIDAVVTAAAPTPPAPTGAPHAPVDALSVEVASLRLAIETAENVAALTALTPRLRALPEAERRGLRQQYDQRLRVIGGRR